MENFGFSRVDRLSLTWYARRPLHDFAANPSDLPGVCTGIMVTGNGEIPFSWGLTDRIQVAVSRTQPDGRVLGVDIIPAQPPKGVSTIQGNFLAPEIQEYIQEFLSNPNRGRPRQLLGGPNDTGGSLLEPGMAANQSLETETSRAEASAAHHDKSLERTVDVVLSDMSAPWLQTSGFWKRSLSDPYNRMMNTSGNNFRDHAGSMVRVHFHIELLCASYLINCRAGPLPRCLTL